MSRAKVFTSILMVLILIALSGVSVWAAPGGAEPTATPTETPTPEPTETPTPEPTEEPTVHPVVSALVGFFTGAAGLDYGEIMEYHEKGNGFGLIAQACFMSMALKDGDPSLFGDILEAKRSHDFSSITLPDGVETPKNWGQFRKAVLGSDKAKKNLGAIMSGREKQNETDGDDLGAAAGQGQGKGKKGKGPGEDGPPGKSKKGSEGDESPAGPPGKGKSKGKGGGKKK